MSFNPGYTSPETRYDRPQIVALDLAPTCYISVVIGGGAAYPAGQVMARVTADDTHEAYDSGGAGGLETAAGIITEDVDASAGDVIHRMLVSGPVYLAKLTDHDAAASVDLYAREVVDGTGTSILIF